MKVQHVPNFARAAHLSVAPGVPLSLANSRESRSEAVTGDCVARLQLESGGDASADEGLGGRPSYYCVHRGAEPALCGRWTAGRPIDCRLQLGHTAALGVLCAAAP